MFETLLQNIFYRFGAPILKFNSILGYGFLFLAFGFLSCDSYDPSKPTTFCKIKGKEISYIINNPPDDTLALKIEVEKI